MSRRIDQAKAKRRDAQLAEARARREARRFGPVGQPATAKQRRAIWGLTVALGDEPPTSAELKALDKGEAQTRISALKMRQINERQHVKPGGNVLESARLIDGTASAS